MFRKETVDIIRKQNRLLDAELKGVLDKRAGIRDTAGRVAAGLSVATGLNTTKELLETLQVAAALKEQNILKGRIAQVNADMKDEIERLSEENTRMEMEILEPISLTLTVPVANQEFKVGSSLTVQWLSTGPVSEKLRIVLLKSGSFFKVLSQSVAKYDGSFNWQIPKYFLFGDDYRVAVQDPLTDITAKSDNFKINK